MQYECSVVMVVKNVEKDIYEILSVLKNQTVNRFEIIIIDTGSLDNTVNIIKSFYSIFKDRLILILDDCTVGKGRQKGAELARTDTILYLDGDCIPPLNWVESLYTEFKSKNCDMLHGKVRTYPDIGFWYKYIGRLYELEYNLMSTTRKKLHQLAINEVRCLTGQ